MNIRIFLLVGGVLSALYLGVGLLLRQPANTASIIELIRTGAFDEVGNIFAWLLSLLAFLWLVIGYLLQSRELHAQSKVLEAERSELERMRGAMAVAVLVLLFGGIWFLIKTQQTSWEVASLAGTPQIGAERIDAIGKLTVGEYISS